MKNLLIINKFQFGYHVDVYKWCQYLKDEYIIEVICFNEGKPIVQMDGVSVHYISSKGLRCTRGIRYILYTSLRILLFRDRIIICGFPGCHVYKLFFPWKKMHLDIRTLTISPDSYEKNKLDKQLKRAVALFSSVTAISKGVADELSNNKHISILPLGADIESKTPKQYDMLKLLYIGTFRFRHIDYTIKAFKKAMNWLGTDAKVHYDIIGDGIPGELDTLQKLVNDLGLSSHVKLHGYIQHDKLKVFLDICNVGLSYVPIIPNYDKQPPTKTFEYALSGLFVIATGTSSNKELITEDNGLIINDGVDDIAKAIIDTYNNKEKISEQKIRESLKKYQWSTIVNSTLKPLLDSLG